MGCSWRRRTGASGGGREIIKCFLSFISCSRRCVAGADRNLLPALRKEIARDLWDNLPLSRVCTFTASFRSLHICLTGVSIASILYLNLHVSLTSYCTWMRFARSIARTSSRFLTPGGSEPWIGSYDSITWDAWEWSVMCLPHEICSPYIWR